jgi:small subunit ribosomal protein S2
MAITTKDAFAALVHVGHAPLKWNPRMKPYFAGKKNNIWVFDLDKSLEGLEKAQKFLSAIKIQNKKVLFVGTKPQSSLMISRLVENKNHFFVDKKWTPGLLTNFREIRKRIDHYLKLKSQFESGEINKYTKKEVAKFKKDLDKLEASYRGVAEMRKPADVVVVLDAVVDRIAVTEANVVGTPIVAITDANADPEGIDYVIPGNDDSLKSIGFLLENMIESLEK